MSRRNGVTVRGTSNGNDSGNSTDRRRRRQWLITQFGDGEGRAPCRAELHHDECPGFVTVETLTVGRIVPGVQGGRYTRDNIRPEFGMCNSRHGGGLRRRS